VIGDYVTFAPGVRCNGNVHIGNHAYIGSGATIIQGTKDIPLVIGEGAIVGMGAVVIKSVGPYTTVAGNPATQIKNSSSPS
jgi:acetyltransferase-like isoleucine patch superfamily enzyme